MKKIGFVDYYIDEWHANKYPGWISEICKKENKDFKVAYAWAECDRFFEDSRTTEQWCNDFGVEKCDSINELCEKCDYIIVLAPSNPEKHLAYAKEVLKHGKRTYIDKTFAPDYATAKEIFELSEKYGTPFFSSSALRYADEIADIKAESVLITGGGGNYDEYIIHQIEMAVKMLGVGAESVKVQKSGKEYISRVFYPDGRAATLAWGTELPFSAQVDKTDSTSEFLNMGSDFFANLLSDILNFFETGERSFDGEETLEVMHIREALIASKNNCGESVSVKK